jgi:hypothetical protein
MRASRGGLACRSSRSSSDPHGFRRLRGGDVGSVPECRSLDLLPDGPHVLVLERWLGPAVATFFPMELKLLSWPIALGVSAVAGLAVVGAVVGGLTTWTVVGVPEHEGVTLCPGARECVSWSWRQGDGTLRGVSWPWTEGSTVVQRVRADGSTQCSSVVDYPDRFDDVWVELSSDGLVQTFCSHQRCSTNPLVQSCR